MVDRLTDVSKYTGSHKERFDATGKGKGLSGRVDVADSSGYENSINQEINSINQDLNIFEVALKNLLVMLQDMSPVSRKNWI